MLSNYISTIRRDDFLPRLNHVLHSRVSSSPGSATSDIQSYYSNRPGLRKYTLGVEMDRGMDYTLILEDGQSISDKDAIRSYLGSREKEEKSTQCGAVATEELLIRAANQSLLADALVALTGSEEMLQPCIQNIEENKSGLILSGPILCMTSVVEKCHFTIDLQMGKLESICVLAISVPVDNRRLVLARAILIANFRPGRRKGQLQYAMQFVKAHHFPLSKTLRDAAISLAKDQENLMFHSQMMGHEEDTAMKKDVKFPQRSFFLFR